MTAIQTGYCTNVHAGADLEQTRANLQRYALAVKKQVRPRQPMGVGLWLSASAASKLIEERQIEDFAGWLAEVGLVPFTLNGFPFGDFHRDVVKHQVYQPTWYDTARLEYTAHLIQILHRLLPPGMAGSISTLPIAWGQPPLPESKRKAAAQALCQIATDLARLEQETGRCICLCLEPEPGCLLQRSEDVLRFFEEDLLPGHDEDVVRRYLRVCHDICHQVVMFEDQQDVLRRYHAAGIGVGKIQVSSAVCLPGSGRSDRTREEALAQLASFHEPRYLHQTVIRKDEGAEPLFYEDLPLALTQRQPQDTTASEWRIHFHVPIYLERFGHLHASQQAILQCLQTAAALDLTNHYEVETYAWTVLPKELQEADLAAGIAKEMTWFYERLASGGCQPAVR